MPNYSDLNTLFNNGMGSFAAVQAGAQSAQEDQLRQFEIQKLQSEAAQRKAMNPLDLMFAQGKVNQQQAELSGIQADSQTKSAAAQVATATVSKTIQAKLGEMENKIGDQGFEQMNTMAKKLGAAGAMIQGVPTMGQPEALKKILVAQGLDPNNPMLASLFQGDPKLLSANIAGISDGMAKSSEAYLQKAALQKQQEEANAKQSSADIAARTASSREVANIGANASRDVARINSDSRLQVAQASAAARQAAASNKLSIDQRISALQTIPEELKTDEDRNNLQALKTQQLEARAAGANALPGQIMGMDTPQAIAARGGASQAPQQAPAPAGGLTPEVFKAQGMPYEPSKYDYRVGPNGQIQRKAK